MIGRDATLAAGAWVTGVLTGAALWRLWQAGWAWAYTGRWK